jgi:hypothetical protein
MNSGQKRYVSYLLTLVLLIGGCAVLTTNCVTNPDGEAGIVYFEEMDDIEFQKWKLLLSEFLSLGVKNAIEEELISLEDAHTLGDLLQGLANSTFQEQSQSLLTSLSDDQDLSDALRLGLLTVELSVLDSGGFTFVNQEDGTLLLSDRMQELLNDLAQALLSQ